MFKNIMTFVNTSTDNMKNSELYVAMKNKISEFVAKIMGSKIGDKIKTATTAVDAEANGINDKISQSGVAYRVIKFINNLFKPIEKRAPNSKIVKALKSILTFVLKVVCWIGLIVFFAFVLYTMVKIFPTVLLYLIGMFAVAIILEILVAIINFAFGVVEEV